MGSFELPAKYFVSELSSWLIWAECYAWTWTFEHTHHQHDGYQTHGLLCWGFMLMCNVCIMQTPECTSILWMPMCQMFVDHNIREDWSTEWPKYAWKWSTKQTEHSSDMRLLYPIHSHWFQSANISCPRRFA